jgi:hypothetical protein
MRVQIKGTTIFGYIRADLKKSRSSEKISFLDEETNQVIKVKASQLKETYQKEGIYGYSR